MKDILVPTAPGELIDKLTILRLKAEHINDAAKLANVQHEQQVLTAIADDALPQSDALAKLWDELYRINGDLWVIEDDIRAFEARGDFGPGFVALARAVYVTNDERAAIKKRINLLLGSAIVEEKSYYAPETNR
ncbi:DUF6165 family protein [Loktanella sp. R86503]|uniref:DUF6165 family protein n=1 Tax=Loktanella sp. R86503 TaxID=3093847 RepID=UPI0036DA2B0F